MHITIHGPLNFRKVVISTVTRLQPERSGVLITYTKHLVLLLGPLCLVFN